MVSSKKTAFGQRQDDPEGSSPERRRLRFSFQINDVKDQSRLNRPHRLAPDVGGGGYLVAPNFRVNRGLKPFATNRPRLGFERKNHSRAPRGFPHKS